MKKLGLAVLAFALLGSGGELATDRRVHGVITAVEPGTLTIASSQRAVTGRIDPARTKVTINGHLAKASELQLTAHARAELCLDDVWVAVDVH